MKEFRAEGGIVKTEEEKKEMAQKHRFKKNREFKQRLDDEEENEAGDIRSFKFHSFEKNYRGELREKKERRPRNEERFSRDGKRFDRGAGKFDKGDKRNTNRSNRFDRNNKRNNSEFEKRKRRFGNEE
jgi:putative N6-adenine-specific DNA methylase